MAKICMISVNHSPLDDRIFYKEALTLKKAGHKISQICRADEQGIMYDMGNITPLNKPGDDCVLFEGIKTFPIPTPCNTVQKLLKKVFKGSFYAHFIETGVNINADVYHAHEPESFYLGLKIANITGAKVIFDSHESYTTGTKKEVWIQKKYLKDLKYLISANHLTRGYLVGLNPKIESTVIYNAAEIELYKGLRHSTPKNIITIAHDGYLPFNRGLKEMLEAFKIVHEKHNNTRLKIIGATTGSEKEYFTHFISQNKLADVVVETGWVPYQDVSTHLAGCQIGLIAKTNTVNNIIGGPPIKYYNYTAAGMAIVDVNMPETSRLLSKFKNGISIPDRSISSLVKGITALVENTSLLEGYQANSLLAFKELNWEKEGNKLINFYQKVVLNNDSLVKH
ncbi:MAG: glycosyltransferase [Salibacteraceae bacterium]